jgi:hypothetical protein
MIPHPTVNSLLTKHGNTPDGRRAARAAITDTVVTYARREAATAGRSINCGMGNHRRTWRNHTGKNHAVGCTDDGTSCICECHDDQTPTGQASS